MSQLDYAAGYTAGQGDYDPTEAMNPVLYTRRLHRAFGDHCFAAPGGEPSYDEFSAGYRQGRDAAVIEAGDSE